jgi:hypothetical protein
MVAIFSGFTDPQFADHAIFGKDVLHSTGLLTLPSKKTSWSPPPPNSRDERLRARVTNQIIMS